MKALKMLRLRPPYEVQVFYADRLLHVFSKYPLWDDGQIWVPVPGELVRIEEHDRLIVKIRDSVCFQAGIRYTFTIVRRDCLAPMCAN